MPVRIYEIAKKVGLESKAVLAKAKEMGISGARVASSSLDKITAEYLIEKILGLRKPAPPPKPAAIPEPSVESSSQSATEEMPLAESKPESQGEAAPEITIITAPEGITPIVISTEPVPPIPEPEEPAPLPPLDETPLPEVAAEQSPVVEVPPEPAPEEAPPAELVEKLPEPPPPPPEPPPPSIGDKVGFIKLPTRPSRTPEKPVAAKVPARGTPQRATPAGEAAARGRPGQRPQFNRRGPGGPGRGSPYGRGPIPAVRAAPAPATPPKPSLPDDAEVITMKSPIIVRDLAERLNKKPHQVIAEMMSMNVWATANQSIDEEVAEKVCAKFGVKFEQEKRRRDATQVRPLRRAIELDEEDKLEDMKPRAPVVTIMGHVDHGKTTLLDVIRNSNVVAGEAGGITQHIGAYTISFPHPERKNEVHQITFLDTPGHAAFSAMRARGAEVTDIVILVVAANDGVMPQTVEALNHARAAEVPIIVAVNKCDHPAANPMQTRQQLNDRGLVPDDWGGDTIFVDVSALAKQGVDKLLEMILLQAELLELKANHERKAKGNVIESGIEPGGPVATVLVRKGTLRVGDVILCDQYYGRVRALINEEGKRLKQVGPSAAVRILGLNGVPEAGIEFTVYQNEKLARDEANKRSEETRRINRASVGQKATLETIFDTLAGKEAKALRVIIKADTQGSEEAIVDALNKIESDKVSLKVLHSAVGTITKDDIVLGSSSNAVILGFHTRVDTVAAELAKREGVQIKLYSVIYELIDEVRDAMAGLLDPILKEVVTGAAEVRKVFEMSKGGNVAGCMVATGRVHRGKVRVMRRKNLIFEGQTASLRRFQDEVNEVRAGVECGIRLDGFNEFQIGDSIECYTFERIASKL